MLTKRIKIPSPKKIGEIIGVPNLEDWKGDCFGIASAIVEDEIVKGKAVYNLPTEPRKIKERIRRHERAFAKEMQEFDMIRAPAL